MTVLYYIVTMHTAPYNAVPTLQIICSRFFPLVSPEDILCYEKCRSRASGNKDTRAAPLATLKVIKCRSWIFGGR